MLSDSRRSSFPGLPHFAGLLAPVGPDWRATKVEAALLVAFFFFYLVCFSPSSAVNGPTEVFGQDSLYILKFLDQGQPYRWNPQSHLLYHVVVERGHEVWQAWLGPGMDSTYLYLKLFTALCGLGFLGTMCWLFCELRLEAGPRVVLLLLTGLSVSAWFHFAAFETHCLALPMVGLYLIALVRLRDRPTRSLSDRAMLIGALLLCGLVRVDLFRFAAMSGLLLVLPGTRRQWRTLVPDLVIVAVLAVVGSTVLATAYLDEPLGEGPTIVLERQDRKDLEDHRWQVSNLAPRPLWTVGRAVTAYSLLMPVASRETGRSFFAPPTYDFDLQRSGRPRHHSTELFLQPLRNLLGNALSLLALTGTVVAMGWAFVLTGRRIAAGDSFHVMLAAQAVSGWLLYSLFNPFEPFLWIVEFLPLWMAMIADHSRGRSVRHLAALAALAVLVATHNVFAFYLPFR